MLINTIKESYRDLIRPANPVEAIVTVPIVQPAANASDFNESEALARRQRRLRRTAQAVQYGSIGWRLRTW
jgi:hypothetical protein